MFWSDFPKLEGPNLYEYEVPEIQSSKDLGF